MPDVSEHPLVLEYFQTLIDKEKLAMERDAERHAILMERDRQAARYYAVHAELGELQKQKIKAELKDCDVKHSEA